MCAIRPRPQSGKDPLRQSRPTIPRAARQGPAALLPVHDRSLDRSGAASQACAAASAGGPLWISSRGGTWRRGSTSWGSRRARTRGWRGWSSWGDTPIARAGERAGIKAGAERGGETLQSLLLRIRNDRSSAISGCPRVRHRETGRSPSPRPRAPVIPVITTGSESPPEPEGRSTSRIRKLHGSSAVSAIQVGPPDSGSLPGSFPDGLKSRPGPVMIAGVMSAWRETTTAGTEGADRLCCRARAGFL